REPIAQRSYPLLPVSRAHSAENNSPPARALFASLKNRRCPPTQQSPIQRSGRRSAFPAGRVALQCHAIHVGILPFFQAAEIRTASTVRVPRPGSRHPTLALRPPIPPPSSARRRRKTQGRDVRQS